MGVVVRMTQRLRGSGTHRVDLNSLACGRGSACDAGCPARLACCRQAGGGRIGLGLRRRLGGTRRRCATAFGELARAGRSRSWPAGSPRQSGCPTHSGCRSWPRPVPCRTAASRTACRRVLPAGCASGRPSDRSPPWSRPAPGTRRRPCRSAGGRPRSSTRRPSPHAPSSHRASRSCWDRPPLRPAPSSSRRPTWCSRRPRPRARRSA